MFGAQLRRELMSIPHACYNAIENHEHQRIHMWTSLRNELQTMSDLLPFMFTVASLKRPTCIFATDAMGSEEGVDGDCGGYGVVGANLSFHEFDNTTSLARTTVILRYFSISEDFESGVS